MRDGFLVREQQLIEVKRSLADSEARNAAESRELTVMLQECRALPMTIPRRLAPPLLLLLLFLLFLVLRQFPR